MAEIHDTYVAAIQHDLDDLPPESTLVGVVRRPTGWFHATVDENVPELGPPPDLLNEVNEAKEAMKLQGMCDEGAHNAAWEETAFDARYREHLENATSARDARSDLANRVRAGESIVLVCYENTAKKRCHRTILREALESQL